VLQVPQKPRKAGALLTPRLPRGARGRAGAHAIRLVSPTAYGAARPRALAAAAERVLWARFAQKSLHVKASVLTLRLARGPSGASARHVTAWPSGKGSRLVFQDVRLDAVLAARTTFSRKRSSVPRLYSGRGAPGRHVLTHVVTARALAIAPAKERAALTTEAVVPARWRA
jgi:hypothetical protein